MLVYGENYAGSDLYRSSVDSPSDDMTKYLYYLTASRDLNSVSTCYLVKNLHVRDNFEGSSVLLCLKVVRLLVQVYIARYCKC